MSGYKLMPEEATSEMEQAAEKYWNDRKFKALPDDPRTWKGLYAAMRAAAPAVQGEPVGYVSPRTLKMLRSGKACGIVMADKPDAHNGVTIPLYAAPQPAVHGEPVAEPRKKDSVLFHLAEILRKAQSRMCDETGDEIDVGYECMRIRDLCKAAPPAPDVSALVEALERINGMDSMSYHSLESAKIVARTALAAYRNQGGEL